MCVISVIPETAREAREKASLAEYTSNIESETDASRDGKRKPEDDSSQGASGNSKRQRKP